MGLIGDALHPGIVFDYTTTHARDGPATFRHRGIPASGLVAAVLGTADLLLGHIVITDPSVKVDVDYRYDNGKVRKVPTMYGAESAGGAGLSFAFCQFIAEDNGIFTIKRHSTPHMGPLRFRAFRVD